VIITPWRHEAAYYVEQEHRRNTKQVLVNKYRSRSLTKAEVLNVYWFVNVIKVSLMMIRCSSSRTKYERQLWNYIKDSWSN
jgi:hypothetical protein